MGRRRRSGSNATQRAASIAVRTRTGRSPQTSSSTPRARGRASWACACGVDLPVTPLRRQVAATVPTDVLPASMPMTIFTGDGFHLRVRDGRVLLLWPTPGVPGAPFEMPVDPAWIEAVHAKASRARAARWRTCRSIATASWAGLYEMSPDKHAILGVAPGMPESLPDQRLVRPRRDARAGARAPARRDHPRRRARRRSTPRRSGLRVLPKADWNPVSELL